MRTPHPILTLPYPCAAQEQRNAVARFLEGRGLAAEALAVATDADYRFELAVGLGELGTALDLAGQAGTEAKWRQLGELALSSGKLQARAALRMAFRLLSALRQAWPARFWWDGAAVRRQRACLHVHGAARFRLCGRAPRKSPVSERAWPEALLPGWRGRTGRLGSQGGWRQRARRASSASSLLAGAGSSRLIGKAAVCFLLAGRAEGSRPPPPAAACARGPGPSAARPGSARVGGRGHQF